MPGARKRVAFRAMSKAGTSKAAIRRELGISRRTAGGWAAADGSGQDADALSHGPRGPVASVLDPYKEIVRTRLSEYPELSAERRSLAAYGRLGEVVR